MVAALLGMMASGVVDQDATHDAGGDGEEVGPVLPLDPFQVDEPEVGFVDQGGRLEGVPGALAA